MVENSSYRDYDVKSTVESTFFYINSNTHINLVKTQSVNFTII